MKNSKFQIFILIGLQLCIFIFFEKTSSVIWMLVSEYVDKSTTKCKEIPRMDQFTETCFQKNLIFNFFFVRVYMLPQLVSSRQSNPWTDSSSTTGGPPLTQFLGYKCLSQCAAFQTERILSLVSLYFVENVCIPRQRFVNTTYYF